MVRVDEGVGVVVVMTVMMMTVKMMTTTVMIALRSNRGRCKNRKGFTSWQPRVVRVDDGVAVVVTMVMMVMTVKMMTTTVMITLWSESGMFKNRKGFTSWLSRVVRVDDGVEVVVLTVTTMMIRMI